MVFVTASTPLDQILSGVALDQPTRVMLCGVPGGGTIGGLRSWTTDYGADGWEADPSGHYLDQPRRAVLRYRHRLGGRADLVISHGWFGDGDGSADPARCEAAWQTIEKFGAEAFRDSPMLNSASATGREWWQRTIPAGREWPTISAQASEAIRATSGQGRIEVLPHAEDRIDRLVELDGRLMYGSLVWAMPVGLRLWDECQPGDYSPHVRARYRVSVTVPAGWDHVGILGVRSDDPAEGWVYPSQPGRTFQTWADGAELHVAASHGWKFETTERMVFGEGKPLDKWAGLLTEAAIAATDPLVRAGLRSILLHGLGAFHSGGRKVIRSLPLARSSEVPADAENPRVEGPVIAWSETRPIARPDLHHPEWTAAIWARARARLLHSKRLGVGALTLPRDAVIAFRTDAIWATLDPHWDDDGRPGRYRVKTIIEGPVQTPRNSADLLALKHVEATL